MLRKPTLIMNSADNAVASVDTGSPGDCVTYDRLIPLIAEAARYEVQSGPYRGMNYFAKDKIPGLDRQPTTKLIGSFESELHLWIESLVGTGFQKIVHIGASSGYHAVGMALRLPGATSVVFEKHIDSRRACRTLASANGVRDRIDLRGFCGADGMLDVNLADSLIVSDCGGEEFSLLDPMLYPNLRLATMLVETHDSVDSRISERLLERFSYTHRIEVRAACARSASDYEFLMKFPSVAAQMALEEHRPLTRDGRAQTWALLRPYSS